MQENLLVLCFFIQSSTMKKHLIVITGATASGKTTLAIQLANFLQTEILSADSRQFFREMNIGTAKPSTEELNQAKHHFIDHLSIHDEYNVGQYERDATLLLEQLFQKYDHVIMVGGSGLYIKAVCDGLDHFPQVDEQFRIALTETFEAQGIETLQEELKQLDPVYYDEVDRQNPHRLIRALEICRATGKPYSSFRTATATERPFKTTKIAIDWEREQLYDRINLRVDQMIDAGLEQEAKSLFPFKYLNSLQTVGYQEWFDYFEGKMDREEAVRLIKRNTRRYAKRQMTWLRRESDIHYFAANDLEGILFLIRN
jgi:tRNA dimethylallyltransferase